jgi:drug/metabolite transporter (DMT)-like permease
MFLTLGIACAVAASVLFNLGLVLQALEARKAPPSLSLRLGLLVVLLRRWRWVLGWVLGIAGVAPQVVALVIAPFVLVQPALTVGLLLVLAIGTRAFGEHVTLPAWVGVAAIIGGVALVAGGAPGHAETHRRGLVVLVVVGAAILASLLPFLVRKTRLDSSLVIMVASGAGFAATNIATKLLSDDVGAGHYWNAAAWGVVTAAAGVGATVTGMTAFQRSPATVVVPVTTAVQTFLPIVLEPLFLRERWGSAPFGGALIAAGMAVALAGTVLVARTPGVAGMVGSASGDAARGGGRRGARTRRGERKSSSRAKGNRQA